MINGIIDTNIVIDLLQEFPPAITWFARQSRRSIAISDVMIASIAVRLHVPLYTRNVKHFAPLPNLDEQQPY